jgi:hypothetical protein
MPYAVLSVGDTVVNKTVPAFREISNRGRHMYNNVHYVPEHGK